ncbi:MAG TPA: response regulator [Solirubrobacteraceae bacterium]|jgi:diguanylate cyclase (GGDEF)-like protein|nr:response regulator [Solirubrobacteraceae bacterium]
MDSGQDALDAIQAIWLRRRASVLARVGIIEAAVGEASTGVLSDELRFQAAREAHMLAGSAGTFGFPRASELARELELALEAPAPPQADELPHLRECVRGLREDLQSSPADHDEDRGDSGPLPAETDVVVVGTDASRLATIAAEVSRRGLVASVAADLETARTEIAQRAPRMVLLDLQPGGGLEQALEFLADVVPRYPVLVIADDDPTLDRVELADHGGRGFLPSTLSVTEMVDSALSLRERLRSPARNVLAVDDDPAVLEALRTVLGSGGLEVHGCTRAADFAAALDRVRPDLVILDLQMPDGDGLELCRGMRADPRWEALPVLVLTASNDPETVQRVFQAGADDFVPKPFVGPELVARISNRLDRLRLYRALAETDHLTRLANRRRSSELLAGFQATAERLGQPLSLAVLDVDAFKAINDAGGHAQGDAALRAIGAVLRRGFQSDDVVARWGGDEFVVGMYGMTAINAAERIARCLEAVRTQRFGSGPTAASVTLSAGVAELGRHADTLDELYRAADEAMYVAKRAGGDRVAVAGSGRVPDRVDVVVVDDDAHLVELLEAALRTRGLSTRAITDGAQAQAELAGEQPALVAPVILLDWDLPGMDGLGVLNGLSRSGALERTRVIMLTARASEQEVLQALSAGAIDHVAKPFSVPVLMQRVRHALAR